MDNVAGTDSLLHALADAEIVVFGTGYVADSFWYGLERHGLAPQVACFVVTDAAGQAPFFHGRPVMSLRDFDFRPGTVLCLAVHRALAEELADTVAAGTQGRVIWIYPYLHGMIYGDPTASAVPVSRAELLRKQDPASCWISVRYLAARDYLRCADSYAQSCEIYLRAMSAHCRSETAEKRLRRLEELADSMAARGFDRNCPILIDTKYRVIDGLHRLSVASVLKIDTLFCDIVPASEAYDALVQERNKLPEHVLLRAGFTEEQMELLRCAKRELAAGIPLRK